jgi:hypothetical protein
MVRKFGREEMTMYKTIIEKNCSKLLMALVLGSWKIFD